MMKFVEMKIYRMKLPLAQSFSNSQTTLTYRRFDLVRLTTTTGEVGWGETVAFETPWYTSETVTTCHDALVNYIWPLIRNKEIADPKALNLILNKLKGHHMARSAVETSFWGIYAEKNKQPLYRLLGSDNAAVAVGISLGMNNLEDLMQEVQAAVEKGYTRVKIKIKPGWDILPVQTIRQSYPHLKLMVDANGAYDLADVDVFKALDAYDLEMIEQPIGDDDFINHAKLQRIIRTKICLDENIHSIEDVKVAHQLGSARAINLKWARVGGLFNALEIIQYCQKHGLLVWCGGMFESGVGRSYNLALASLEGLDFPGDISESSRYWSEDIVEQPQKLVEGRLLIPKISGAGFNISKKRVEKYSEKIESFI